MSWSRREIALLRKFTTSKFRAQSAAYSRGAEPAPSFREAPVNVIVENPPGRVSFISDMKRELVPWQEALKCLRAYSIRTVPESVQLSLLVNMTTKGGKTKDSFKGTLQFPHPFGDARKVLLIGEVEAQKKSTAADLVGGEEILEQILRKKFEEKFDVVVTTFSMYPKFKPLQHILKVKMPNPRTGTVVDIDQVDEAVLALKSVKAFRSSKCGTINCSVGTLDFKDQCLEENMRYVVQEVMEHKGTLTEDKFLKRLTMSTSYGPGFDIFCSDFLG